MQVPMKSLFVLAAISILAATVLLLGQCSSKKEGVVTANKLAHICQELKSYKKRYGRYPSSLKALKLCSDCYGERVVVEYYFYDEWGHDFIYKSKGNFVTSYSLGPNGIDESGRGDDIPMIWAAAASSTQAAFHGGRAG